MIVYRINYQTCHDLGGWLSLVTYRKTRKLAKKFRKEVLLENVETVSNHPNCPLVPDDVMDVTIHRVKINNRHELLAELNVAVLAGQP